jgi:GDP-L-fucose synthase
VKQAPTPDSRIFVAGHRGMVGSAIVRSLESHGFVGLLTATRDRLDLRDPAAVNRWFNANHPEYVIVAAGTVGGIMANTTRPAELMYDNLMIHTAVIHAAHTFGVRKLLYLGSGCLYPNGGSKPVAESALLSGPLEPTTEAYALAKIAGVKLCQAYRRQFGSNFISAMPPSLYGPGPNFDLEGSQVIPALIRKFHEAKQNGERQVTVWGTGNARREFMHVDDMAEACVFLMNDYDELPPINVGTGEVVTIRELAEMIRNLVHARAKICWDTSKPDGAVRQPLDVSRLRALGWRHAVSLQEGLAATYRWYRKTANGEAGESSVVPPRGCSPRHVTE